MSQHQSLKGSSKITARRNVMKRFERIEVLKKQGRFKDGQRVFGLPKTKPVVLVRLQKFLAEAGIASRRQSEQFIQDGRVRVNGKVASLLGTKIEPGKDQVTVDGQPVSLERKVYIALNKPAGYICTSRDTHDREVVLDLLPASLPRLYTVGRLDRDTEGLLFLTNDGNFSLRLTHPRYKMPKLYFAEVNGQLTAESVAQLLSGVRSDGETLKAEKVFEVHTQPASSELQLIIREGRKRQIRRMLSAVGHTVRRLKRVAIGPVNLGDLKLGQWRYLTDEEVQQLLENERAGSDAVGARGRR